MAALLIEPDVAAVLKRTTSTASEIKLPDEVLDRKLYVRVNKVLEAIGGQWNRKQQAHVFPDTLDAHQELCYALADGYVVVESDSFFPTPPHLVNLLIARARIEQNHRVLEPSAGEGAIADALNDHVFSNQIVLIEINAQRCQVLRDKGYFVIETDFLQVGFNHDGFDRVVMNPPFERSAEVDHVMHAYGLLRGGGRLVSVMSNGITFRDDRKYSELRALIGRHGEIEANPPDSFKPAGTSVHTVIVTIDKPES